MDPKPDDVCTWCKRPRSEHEENPGRPDWQPADWLLCPGSKRATAPDEFDPAAMMVDPVYPSNWTRAAEPARGEGLGLGKDAPVTTNAAGGRQSHTPYRCDLFPPFAFLAVSEVLKHGADKYGANNWHAITVSEHLNHAIGHLFALLAGDGTDDHLEHAACRVVMALDQKRSGRDNPAA